MSEQKLSKAQELSKLIDEFEARKKSGELLTKRENQRLKVLKRWLPLEQEEKEV